MPGGISLTFAIDPGLLSNQAALGPGVADSVVRDALTKWTYTSRGRFTFTESPWPAVRNEGPAPPDQWEGPGLLDWLSGNFPGTSPGWGANIEVFSVPAGFTMTSQSLSFTMNANVLGFTVVNRIGSRNIMSVDIYLNESFTWFDAMTSPGGPADGVNQNNQIIAYDVRAVVLHEIGHALGLDHPNQAVAKGSWNISPILFQQGDPWSSLDLMHSVYNGPRNVATLDEVGGLAIVYGWPSPVDTTNDGVIDGGDLSNVLSDWGLTGGDLHGDLNFDQTVNTFDLSLILSNFGAQPESPGLAAPLVESVASDALSTPVFRECYAGPHAPGATRHPE